MDERTRTRWKVTGVVEAPVERVAELLLDVRPGPASGANTLVLSTASVAAMGRIVLHGGPRLFTAVIGQPPATSIDVEVDQDRRSIAVQGHRCYRGVHTVESRERGSLLVHRVDNIAAPTTRWIVPLMQRRQLHTMRQDLERLLAAIGERLGCATYPNGA